MKTKVKCAICGENLLKSAKGNVFCGNKKCSTYINEVGEIYFANKRVD